MTNQLHAKDNHEIDGTQTAQVFFSYCETVLIFKRQWHTLKFLLPILKVQVTLIIHECNMTSPNVFGLELFACSLTAYSFLGVCFQKMISVLHDQYDVDGWVELKHTIYFNNNNSLYSWVLCDVINFPGGQLKIDTLSSN